jgi:Mn-dependent DtxR family transcriptional regulator
VADVELMDLQKKAIDAVIAEGPIEAGGFAAKFSLDPGMTAEALGDLEKQGFMRRGDDGRYSLTAKGEELHDRWERHSFAPARRSYTWQSP